MVIVDSSVWIDYINGTETLETFWLDQVFPHKRLGMTDLIFCEVLQGIRLDSHFRRVHGELRKVKVLSGGGEEIAFLAAQNYRFLRSKGVTVRKTIDCLIASFCIAEGHSLLHCDRDFDPFEQHLGLSVVHPSSQ